MGIDGVVVVGSLRRTGALEDLLRLTPAVMILGAAVWDGVQADGIVADDAIGVGLALNHLRGLGHERIAHLAVPESEVGQARLRAYIELMEAAGLGAEVAVEAAENTEDGGFRAGVRLLARPSRPTGIIAYNDITAIGALSAARDMGVDVPAEVSIVGYDNMIIARSKAIALTTLEHATFDVGRRAVELLIERAAAPGREATTQLIPPQLVVRMTTAPRPRD
jgi:DNA-binding LacI/PurR family transcriptional regulator